MHSLRYLLVVDRILASFCISWRMVLISSFLFSHECTFDHLLCSLLDLFSLRVHMLVKMMNSSGKACFILFLSFGLYSLSFGSQDYIFLVSVGCTDLFKPCVLDGLGLVLFTFSLGY
jgi:hypothetical protein